MKKTTINYATAWLMGIDLIATGKQLKAKRRSHSLTQEELSECFEQGGDSASRAVISMWENGKKLPSLSHVVFLAELYSCSLDELVISCRRSREADDGDQPVPFYFPYGMPGTNAWICVRSSSSRTRPCIKREPGFSHILARSKGKQRKKQCPSKAIWPAFSDSWQQT